MERAGDGDLALPLPRPARPRWDARAEANPLGVRALAIDPTNPSTLYAAVDGFLGNEGGVVFRSTNSGNSWHPIDTGLPNGGNNLGISTLAVAPTTPPAIYATWFGVFSLQ